MKSIRNAECSMPNAERGNQAWNHAFGILHVALGIQAGRFSATCLKQRHPRQQDRTGDPAGDRQL